MSALEWIAAIATLVNVFLVMRGSLWNWPWGILAVVLYGKVFLDAQLYANTWLQVGYYLPMQVLGWWFWLRGGPKKSDDLPVTRLSTRARLGWVLVAVPLSAAWGCLSWWLATSARQPIPPMPVRLADAATTGLSVIGQILLTQKKIENWAVWVLVNVVYAFYLLPVQKLWVSAGLYFVLLGMALQGWRSWVRMERENDRISAR
jgi:nicotinamide mononucleotide transporter